MVDSYVCTFCGEPIEPGTGKMYVKKDGTIFYFCSSKCQNNYRLGRVPRRVTWTKAGRKALGKD
ncbi:MAG: 50S ribosomal protein L24e [Methanomicrobium sp.]|jgi:large subunit ribosomal protein L24e|uniref:50S ribosomal protein L24e n=1 Tax=Methanomicrobium mobile TaxID=2205 RepID=UPI0005B262FB|nr:50S ribosomal protein L24e [Methanomicrobium mobile]MBO7388643.1 50S ribosomal protein L24e [Methanomicrobium sp.]MBP5083636.1 50S ribosomal protein L24e [Methanomicrobium sp.]MBP5474779.1 50S ribosomal protein L24e [Methanomicrobium sp.]MBQ3717904.1 50S ribosomal protein L24e [Methanomicrobium sp.]MBQ4415444.1 50S ribosomal protein L24e [Methanomicrobium sp.]